MKQIHEATMKPLNESQYMCVYIYMYMMIISFQTKLLLQHLLLRT